MNESQVRKIVRQEIKKHDERSSRSIKKKISKSIKNATLKAKDDFHY